MKYKQGSLFGKRVLKKKLRNPKKLYNHYKKMGIKPSHLKRHKKFFKARRNYNR